jgi:hypothetical protein
MKSNSSGALGAEVADVGNGDGNRDRDRAWGGIDECVMTSIDMPFFGDGFPKNETPPEFRTRSMRSTNYDERESGGCHVIGSEVLIQKCLQTAVGKLLTKPGIENRLTISLPHFLEIAGKGCLDGFV